MLKFITGNKGKFQEIEKAFLPIKLEQAKIDLVEIQELDAREIINHKVNEALKHHETNFFVEDTSLYYEALKNKLPGPLIKWFLNTLKSKGLYEVGKRLGNRKVELRSLVGYVDGNKKIHFFESKTQGILVKPIGIHGFGLDPIFKPLDFNKTLAQMTRIERPKFSPRAKAVAQLKKFLKTGDNTKTHEKR